MVELKKPMLSYLIGFTMECTIRALTVLQNDRLLYFTSVIIGTLSSNVFFAACPPLSTNCTFD